MDIFDDFENGFGGCLDSEKLCDIKSRRERHIGGNRSSYQESAEVFWREIRGSPDIRQTAKVRTP
jgi:hypothetical protein